MMFVVLIRAAIGLVSGEIAIRYFSWWIVLHRSREKLTAAPVILGVAICAMALCGIELQWMVIRASPLNVSGYDITENHALIGIFRITLLAGAMFLSYPVNVIHHNHPMERSVTEMLVRLFLILASFLAGIECATIYHCQVLGAC